MTETRETKIRERFEARHVANYGAAADLRRFGDGEYQNALARYEWRVWKIAEAAGREDGLEEAAQMFPEDEWGAVVKMIRSLSSKKDSEVKNG